jgi:hypothetical protein
MDMEVGTATSMGLSMIATASSVVLWVIQFFDKQPNLKAYWVSLNPFRGHVYPVDDSTEVQPLLLRLAVANHSSTTDALLQIGFRVRSADGKWLQSRPYLNIAACAHDVARHLESTTALPINLPPKQTVLLCRYLQIAVPRGVDFDAFVKAPLEIEVELVSLAGPRFRRTIVMPEILDDYAEMVVDRAA